MKRSKQAQKERMKAHAQKMRAIQKRERLREIIFRAFEKPSPKIWFSQSQIAAAKAAEVKTLLWRKFS